MSTTTKIESPPLVNIALPIWKRLEYLPHILQIIESQDYPCIELIVSDNGENGSRVHDIVKAHYSRPFRFRQNPKTVSVGQHFNQIFETLNGKYVVLVCDDDEISANYISKLVEIMEKHPQVSVAFARQEIMNGDGVVIRKSNDFPLSIVPGMEFIGGLWKTFEIKFEAIGTFMARSVEVMKCGGYPDFAYGNGIDNALVIKLCLGSEVALHPGCTWRWRVHEAGLGWSVRPRDLAAAHIQYMRFLQNDSVLRKLSATRSAEWEELKDAMVQNEWQTYLWRWRDIYRHRLSAWEWVRAAFVMPLIPAYYRKVASVFRNELSAWARKVLGINGSESREGNYFNRDR